MAERSGNEHAVEDHLRHTRAKVMAVFADIMGDPRSDKLLGTRENTGSEHLGTERVRLKLLEVHLQIAGLGLSSSQTLANLVGQVFGFLLNRARGVLILEFDGHDGGVFGDRNERTV